MTRNGCVKPPEQETARLAQHFKHSGGTTLHHRWERASKHGMYGRPYTLVLNLRTWGRTQGGDQLFMAPISLVRASKSETLSFILCLRIYSM